MKTSKLNLLKKTVSSFTKSTTNNNKFWGTTGMSSGTTTTGFFDI